MQIDLAWRNLLVNPRRTLLALFGIGFSVLLMFMQIGFLRSVRRNVTILYNSFAADLVITSAKYVSLQNTEPFDNTRLVQARLVPGVARVGALKIAFLEWKDKTTKVTRTCAVIAPPSDPGFTRDAGLVHGMAVLDRAKTVLVDELSDRAFGPIGPGTIAEIGGQNITVASNYRMGLGLYAKGAVVTSAGTFDWLTHSRLLGADFGLVQIAPGADRAAVGAALRRMLPADVLILDRDMMMRAEQDSYFDSKPVGIIFRVGALVSFLVGSVIFYQILSTDIANHLREYATLKALGFRTASIYLVGIRQALLYAGCSYLGSALLAVGLFQLISHRARMALRLDLTLALIVLTFTLVMCGTAAVLALRRVRKADPAELF